MLLIRRKKNMARSYIKLYGPPIVKALKSLEQIAFEMSKKIDVKFYHSFVPPLLSHKSMTMSPDKYWKRILQDSPLKVSEKKKLVSKAYQTLGEYDFFFEWSKDPTLAQILELIEKLDVAINRCGCRYTITTK